MNMTPVDLAVLRLEEGRHAHCRVRDAIAEFMHSGHDAVELHWEPGEYASAASVQSVYSKRIKVMGAKCFAKYRRGHVYLVKEEANHD